MGEYVSTGGRPLPAYTIKADGDSVRVTWEDDTVDRILSKMREQMDAELEAELNAVGWYKRGKCYATYGEPDVPPCSHTHTCGYCFARWTSVSAPKFCPGCGREILDWLDENSCNTPESHENGFIGLHSKEHAEFSSKCPCCDKSRWWMCDLSSNRRETRNKCSVLRECPAGKWVRDYDQA